MRRSVVRTASLHSDSFHSGSFGRGNNGEENAGEESPSARRQVVRPLGVHSSAGTKKTASPNPAGAPADASAYENPPTAMGRGARGPSSGAAARASADSQ